MITILGIILKIFGSSAMGTMFGGIMGYFNRKVDLQHKKLEFEHELRQREMDAKLMEQEWAGRVKVAETEGSFDALTKSYEFAQPDKGTKMAAFSAFIRPFITLSYFVVTSLGSAWILYYAFCVRHISFTEAQWFELTMFVIDWVTFMASTAIGWYYAMRAGTAPKR